MTARRAWVVVTAIWTVRTPAVWQVPFIGTYMADENTDASVTQSALEEALASNMQAGGGMASRMSSISQAIRSKYL